MTNAASCQKFSLACVFNHVGGGRGFIWDFQRGSSSVWLWKRILCRLIVRVAVPEQLLNGGMSKSGWVFAVLWNLKGRNPSSRHFSWPAFCVSLFYRDSTQRRRSFWKRRPGSSCGLSRPPSWRSGCWFCRVTDQGEFEVWLFLGTFFLRYWRRTELRPSIFNSETVLDSDSGSNVTTQSVQLEFWNEIQFE